MNTLKWILIGCAAVLVLVLIIAVFAILFAAIKIAVNEIMRVKATKTDENAETAALNDEKSEI